MNIMITTSQIPVIEAHTHERKGIQTQHYRKSLNHKAREQKEERTKITTSTRKPWIGNGNKYIPVCNLSKGKWTKCSSQKT